MNLLSNSGQGHFSYIDVENQDLEITVEGDIKAGDPDQYASQIGRMDLRSIFTRYGRDISWILVTGNSMMGERLHPGDLLVVHKSRKPRFGDLVAVHIDGAEQPVVKKWTSRGIYSVYRTHTAKANYKTATMVGVVVFQVADRCARFDDDGFSIN